MRPNKKLNLTAEEIYEQNKTNQASNRTQSFIIKALKEKNFKVRKQQKRFSQLERGKLPFEPTDLPLIFQHIDSLQCKMAFLLCLLTAAIRFDEDVSIFSNKYVNWAVGVLVLFQLVIIYTPLATLFHVVPLTLFERTIIAISFSVVVALAKVIAYVIDKNLPASELDY